MQPSFTIVFALYPRVTQLDFTGPHEVLAQLPGARCVLASAQGGNIRTDSGITFAELARLQDIAGCDLLCVPGGLGTIAALEDQDFLAQLRRLSASARYTASVCTGSLLLGAAGLLKGKRAACHWAWRDSLAAFGAQPDPARVVVDGDIISGGGVTAGIDMALTLMAEIAGADYAQTVQLALEYAPAPPFAAGRPEDASPAILAAARTRLDALRDQREAAIIQAAARL
ncbi:DJ-1/PfpI family protein [Chromobacterium subtsugae]|uniref:DJ-1/PfpI family protein n=1 Tax=Chromobacterium subtsugae TaxID=251747 RepID=UPI000641471A|nr:DJ-1/PfpI family protein [Chromobacterium subtsugae]OBU85304.1 thiamine biosynthesis protein ThiJ [Chromobacterium subtsugae]